MKKIFISHSSKDKKYVESIIELLEACGVKSNLIFCSSYEGYGIPLGENFLERIRLEIEDDALVLFVLSNNFYKSAVSICEMGAAWVKTNKHIPILIPPFEYQDIKGVINLTQGLKINEPEKLNSLYEKLKELEYTSGDLSFNIWERKRGRFLEEIDNLMENSPIEKSEEVLIESLTEKVDKQGSRILELTKLIDDKDMNIGKNNIIITNLNNEIVSYKNALQDIKDGMNEKEILIDLFNHAPEKDDFDTYIEEIKVNLEKLPGIVVDALYYAYSEKEFFVDSFNNPVQWESATRAAEEDFLEIEGNWVTVNRNDPKVKRTIRSLDLLRDFIEAGSSDFHNSFELKYDICAKLSNKRFWVQMGFFS